MAKAYDDDYDAYDDYDLNDMDHLPVSGLERRRGMTTVTGSLGNYAEREDQPHLKEHFKADKPRYRAGSKPVGTCEHEITLGVPITPAIKCCWMLLCRVVDRLSREDLPRTKSGQLTRKGLIGHIGLEALDWLKGEIDMNDGYAGHTYEWIAEAIRRSRTAVVEGMRGAVKISLLRSVLRREKGKVLTFNNRDKQAGNAWAPFVPWAYEGLALKLFGEVPVPQDLMKHFEELCRTYGTWRVEWRLFLEACRKVWIKQGWKPRGPGDDVVIDKADKMDDLPKPAPEPEPVAQAPKKGFCIDDVLAQWGGPRPASERDSSPLDTEVPWEDGLSEVGRRSQPSLVGLKPPSAGGLPPEDC